MGTTVIHTRINDDDVNALEHVIYFLSRSPSPDTYGLSAPTRAAVLRAALRIGLSQLASEELDGKYEVAKARRDQIYADSTK